MTTAISKFVMKTLCDNQGCLDFRRLDERITQSFTGAEQVVKGVLFDRGRVAIQEGRQAVIGNKMMSPDSLIVAKTSLRLCQRKPGQCQQCDGLHLCKFYVCGDCTFGQLCKNPHSLVSPYNAELLKRHGLQDLTEKQLYQLLLQNDPYLLPEICPHYNKGNGTHGSCKFTTSCSKLHVCQHFLRGDCKFGSSCKRTHDFSAQGMKIFRGFSQENIIKLPEIYRNKCIIKEQEERPATAVPVMPGVKTLSQESSNSNPGFSMSSNTDAERKEICLYFIRKHCSFKGKCVRVHWHLPYRWQVLDSDGVTWKDLPNMEDIEKDYCDPKHDAQRMAQPSPIISLPSVNFMSMTYGWSPVRRLSTVSSVSKPPHFIFTTEWLWYWKDESGKWLEYGQSDSAEQASVTSKTLENEYLADRQKEIQFSTGKHGYILQFKGAPGTLQMYQQNVQYKTKREVRRRPRFVSAHDVELKLKSTSSQSSYSFPTESFPSHWDKNALPDFGYKTIALSKSVEDYNEIETLFKRTMPQSRINSIQRIQNPSLWKVFQWQEEQMKNKNGGKAVNKRYLFHGTDESLVEAICEQNFDWRICGVHGTAFGKGSYFARDASYSARYSRSRQSLNKIMFVALVLVGESIRGNSSYVRPPQKANGKTFYDSCVDHDSNPSIYVIFDKQQIYPEYLVNYS